VILSDRTIRAALASGRLGIDPLDAEAVQPSSVDVRLAGDFRVFANHRHLAIDPHEVQPDLTDLVQKSESDPFVLHPGEFVLWSCTRPQGSSTRASTVT
jgi:dCTP deaminase